MSEPGLGSNTHLGNKYNNNSAKSNSNKLLISLDLFKQNVTFYE